MSTYERLKHEIKGVRDVVDAQDEVSIEAQVLVPLDDADALLALVEAVDRMMNPHKFRHEEKHPYRNDAKDVDAALARVMED